MWSRIGVVAGVDIIFVSFLYWLSAPLQRVMPRWIMKKPPPSTPNQCLIHCRPGWISAPAGVGAKRVMIVVSSVDERVCSARRYDRLLQRRRFLGAADDAFSLSRFSPEQAYRYRTSP